MNKANRATVFVLIFVLLATMLNFSVVTAEEKEVYTEVQLGSAIKVTGGAAAASGMVAEKKGGREGLTTVIKTDSIFVYVDIDDEKFFDVPNETPLDITVEYYDGGKGFFGLTYDSYNPSKGWGGKWDEILKSSNDYVYLTDSREWKSYTFHVEDIKAANRVSGYDFRVALWTKENGKSPNEVTFGGVKVEESKLRTPIDAGLTVGGLGGIASAEDELTFNMNLRNKSNEPIAGKITSKVYDANDKCIQDVLTDYSFEIEPYETKTDTASVNNPKIHGLYRVESSVEVWYKNSPQEKMQENIESKFSISYVFDETELDPGLLIHHEISEPYGTPEAVAESLVKAGAGFYRDDGLKSELVDGKYVVSEYNKEIFRICKERGIDVVQILYSQPTRGWNDFPETDAEIAEYAKWIGDVAADLKGLVTYFEIYNEANLTAFNKKNTPPETYAKICKAAYDAIKKANPEAMVMGICTAAANGLSIDYRWTKRAFDAGAYDYLDIISLHPYSCWSGIFDEEKWIYSANVLRELMSQYGEIKPIWMTEYGFSTWSGKAGYTREEASVNHILSRALNKAYNLYDNYCYFSLCDRTDIDDIEHNWGMLNYWETPESTPYSAKEAFVAMNAYSYFIDKDTVFKGKIDDDREKLYRFEIDKTKTDEEVDEDVFSYSFATENTAYALNFYNQKLGKNVLYLQTGNGEAVKTINLGCGTVELYDMYGNKKADIVSDNGIFTFALTEKPVYIVGSFTQFAEADSEPAIKAVEPLRLDAVSGDIMELKFKTTLDKELVISTDENIEVVENKGFVNGEASLKVRVEATDKEEQKFCVTIADKNGKVYYCEEQTFNITPPVEVDIKAEPANNIGNNYYRVRTTIKNLSNASYLSGTFAITGPENVAMINAVREFKDLVPDRTVTFISTLPEKVNKNVVSLIADVNLTNGYSASYNQNINFTTVAYAKNKPVIDGVMGEGEWTGSWVGADELKDVREIDNWEGAEEVSFNGTMMWDEENLYFVGIGIDDVHFTQYEGDASGMWQVDSFQIAFDDREEINPVEDSGFTEIGLGVVPNRGDTVYRFSSLFKEPAKILEESELVVKRYDTYTLYECKIPWDEIFYEGYELRPDDTFRMSVLLNDNDGDARGWIEYTSGVGWPKSASLFGDVKFTR